MSLQPHLLVCLCSSSSIHLHQQPQSPSLACYISIPRSLFPISYDLDTALSTLNCRSVHLHMSPSICPVLYMYLQQLSISPSALSISTELFQSSSLGLYTSISLSTFLKSPTSISSSPTPHLQLCSSPCSFSQQEAGRRAIQGLGLHSVSVDSAGGESGQAGGGRGANHKRQASPRPTLSWHFGRVEWHGEMIQFKLVWERMRLLKY